MTDKKYLGTCTRKAWRASINHKRADCVGRVVEVVSYHGAFTAMELVEGRGKVASVTATCERCGKVYKPGCTPTYEVDAINTDGNGQVKS